MKGHWHPLSGLSNIRFVYDSYVQNGLSPMAMSVLRFGDHNNRGYMPRVCLTIV